MAYSYHGLPLHTVFDIINNKNKAKHYKKLSNSFNENQISKLQTFHQGNFQLSGTNHFMPDFIISDDAKKTLNYPQGFLIMEADSAYYTDRSNLDSYEIRFTLNGKGFLEYRGEKYELKEGEGFFIDCKEKHRYGTLEDQWTSTIFHVNGPLVETLFAKYSSDNNVKFSILTCPNFEMLQIQVLKASQKIMPYREYKLSCLLDLLLTELLTTKGGALLLDSGKDTIASIINYLEEHYQDDITLEMLTHDFGINRTNLCREFKNYTGFSIKKYILTLRMNQAKKLLQNSNYRVEEISEIVGFHDTAHFIQIFKKMVGVTPHQFRQ